MKLATFTEGARTRIGVVSDQDIVDLSAEPDFPTDMISLLAAGAPVLERVRAVVSKPKKCLPLASVRLEAPILDPRKFLGLGGSYRSHLAEVSHLGIQPPKFQTWFNKQVTCINAPYGDIHMPRVSDTLDYEGELAFVIGKRCRHV